MLNYQLIKVILTFTFINLSFNFYAQCDLNSLEKDYGIGRFEYVNSQLRECLTSFKNDPIKYQAALRLLTMNSIMMDKMDQAIIDVNSLLDFNSDYIFDINDPFVFRQLVEKYRKLSNLTVTSVSKFEENFDEAPASIYVITEKIIKNRGYLDLEQIFNDLPGFSLSKSNGPGYVTIYPRGLRSTLNDKFLLLIDGIEDNDLNSDNAVINRQIALSNIKQIEVIYGPSSTMYGANAFSAVVNIITKNASFKGENKFSADIQTNAGTWNTNFIDAMFSRKIKNGYFSLTGRLFHSDEMDITDQGYNYSTENFSYSSEFLPLEGQEALDFVNKNGTNSPYFNYNDNSVSLNETGADRMKELDNNFYAANPNIGTNNREDNWFINAKLKIDKFTFGIQSYKTNTGAQPWYPKRFVASNDLSRWITLNSSIYAKYEKKFNQNLFLTNLTSYRLHTLDGNTNISTISTFNTNRLNFQDLIDNTLPSLTSTYFYRSSNQLRNELKLFYKKNKFNLITGIELRQGIFQMDYLRTTNVPKPNENLPLTEEVGITGGNYSNKLDIGYFAQGKYLFSKNLSLILGGRLDYNLTRSNGGFGFVFNPRAAIVYSKRNKFTFKAIYSEAFKDASFLTKYATTDDRIANPNLEPEKVKNFEISTIVRPLKDLRIEVSAFMSLYSNVVVEVEIENRKTQNQASEEGNNIKGIQANLSYKYKNFSFWSNYTFLHPIDQSNNLRVSDIPKQTINAGFNLVALKKINFNLRANYVGTRETGLNTSGSSNPLNEIDSYLTLHTNVNYNLFKGFQFGMLINNLLDSKYFHPGVRAANNISNRSVSLQNSRTFMLRANYKF